MNCPHCKKTIPPETVPISPLQKIRADAAAIVDLIDRILGWR